MSSQSAYLLPDGNVQIALPLVALQSSGPLVRAPVWLPDLLQAGGYGLFVLWLVGTEIYLRWEDARHG